MTGFLDEADDLELAGPVVTYADGASLAEKGSTHMSEADGASLKGPLYRQLAMKLRAEIESGSRGANELLPSERDIAVQYAMSRDTVRKAVRLLEQQGLLYSEHGRGTFVAPSSVREMSRTLDSFSQDTEKRGGAAGQTILLVERLPASIAIAGVLKIEPRQMIMRVKRIRTIDGAPVGVHDAYLALPHGGSFTEDDLVRAGSLYKLLASRFGLNAAEGLESLGSVAANAEDAAQLSVAVGAPLLLCERITLSERRQPMEYCEMKYVSSYRYTARINRFSQR
ncbi:MAG: GntR family transcriptional regulator [Rhizobiaceae bacterium]|nr:GntR family transcriptional regulator [Rhizobiaceae bacterium]